ncbi:hypothetical protein T03_1180 [Trichinella britovi]|uniref:Uncharacterized protein n=1 Tax=Trichinella britovi TaxID=45882 RepID=A0A0V1CXP4_TRIBR|nr:hypothetical protein T09_6779 [Trichinella sp. T9]KRY54033.1 hypothetical protein T03_1180 [Trichinella britovi]
MKQPQKQKYSKQSKKHTVHVPNLLSDMFPFDEKPFIELDELSSQIATLVHCLISANQRKMSVKINSGMKCMASYLSLKKTKYTFYNASMSIENFIDILLKSKRSNIKWKFIIERKFYNWQFVTDN